MSGSRFKIAHYEPVWERTMVQVDVDEETAALLREEDPDTIQQLLEEAITNRDAFIEVDQKIDSMDSDVYVEESP